MKLNEIAEDKEYSYRLSFANGGTEEWLHDWFWDKIPGIVAGGWNGDNELSFEKRQNIPRLKAKIEKLLDASGLEKRIMRDQGHHAGVKDLVDTDDPKLQARLAKLQSKPKTVMQLLGNLTIKELP